VIHFGRRDNTDAIARPLLLDDGEPPDGPRRRHVGRAGARAGSAGCSVGHETSGLVKRRNSTSTRRVNKPLWSVLLAIAIAQTRVPDATSATSEQE